MKPKNAPSWQKTAHRPPHLPPPLSQSPMAAVDHPAALPQRPPRGRRHLAASGATLKRSRDQEDAEEDRRRRTDAAECAAATTRDAGGDMEEVTVTWSASSEKPPGEAADGQHCFECAWPEGAGRAGGSLCGCGDTDAAAFLLRPCGRLGPHGGHPAALLCVLSLSTWASLTSLEALTS
jgi:hypothetical protein